MNKRWSWLLLPIFAAPLVMTSTVTCGCEPDPNTIAGQMGIYKYPGEELASSAQNQAIGRRVFIGRDISKLVSTAAIDTECSQISRSEIRCNFWNEVGILQSKGRAVTIQADPNGKVTQVTVKAVRRITLLEFGEDA